MSRRNLALILVVVALCAGVTTVVLFTPVRPASPPAPAVRTSDSPPAVQYPPSILDKHLLVAWYGNPWTGRMGVLGRYTGAALADGLKKQASAYAAVTHKPVLPAYELIATVAQAAPGTDGMYRRRENRDVIDRMLKDARAAGFKLILDIQVGRSNVMREIEPLAQYLAQPDVYLALDPEFSMGSDGVPGKRIGTMPATQVNDAIVALERLIERHHLPPKILIVHQFTTGMLPDKEAIYTSSMVDIVLDMDGFGPPSLKRSTYRAVLRQRPLQFTGFKLFYIQDTDLLKPTDVLGLSPSPAVIIYQ